MARRVRNGRAALVAAVPTPPSARASARVPALTLTHVDSDVGRGARPARPPGPTHQVRLPDVPRRGRAAEDVGPYHRSRPQVPTTDSGHRFRPQVPATDSDHRFRPQIPTKGSGHRFRPPSPTTVPDRPPVCCVIRPRSRNKSRPSRCVPFRSEIARRHAGGPRLSRPSFGRVRTPSTSSRAIRRPSARPSRGRSPSRPGRRSTSATSFPTCP